MNFMPFAPVFPTEYHFIVNWIIDLKFSCLVNRHTLACTVTCKNYSNNVLVIYFAFVLVWFNFNIFISNSRINKIWLPFFLLFFLLAFLTQFLFLISVFFQITKSWVEVSSSLKTSAPCPGWSWVVIFSCLSVLQFCLLQLISESVQLNLNTVAPFIQFYAIQTT